MPTYLLHGFRWHREAVRIHIIMNNLDDAAAEWIIAPATSRTLLNSFYANFDFLPPSNPPQPKYTPAEPWSPSNGQEVKSPKTLRKGVSMNGLRSLGRKSRPPKLEAPMLEDGARGKDPLALENGHTNLSMGSRTSRVTTKGKASPTFNEWSAVKLMEQYDPNDTQVVSQPYAYVSDYMVEITLSASLKAEMAKYEERSREAEWPLSNTSSPRASESSSQASDVGAAGMSARDVRRKSRRTGWFEKLRNELQKGEDIGWYVVYCGDEERNLSLDIQRVDSRDTGRTDDSPQRTPRSAALKAFFRGRSNTYED